MTEHTELIDTNFKLDLFNQVVEVILKLSNDEDPEFYHSVYVEVDMWV